MNRKLQIMNRIRGSLVDGRLENVRYRQNQLHQLHAALCENAEELCDTLSERNGSSRTLAETEFYLAMDSIKQAYHTLDLTRELNEEYLVKKGKDNLSRRVGVGVIAIRPGTQGRLYSIATPLAMAIAAKNCVCLEESSSKIDTLLRAFLPKSLDRDLFAISPNLTESEIANADLFLDGTHAGQSKMGRDHGVTSGRSVAVIDRSANLEKAAVDIVNSRRSPNFSSPYSPDFIIVNQFVQAEFRRSCSRYAESIATNTDSCSDTRVMDTPALHEAFEKAERRGSVTITRPTTASGLTFVEIIDSSYALALTEITGSYLLILPSTGVVDTATSQRGFPPHIATYIFAETGTAKFLSEQIASSASYINQIPQQLLFGPISIPHSLHPRYTVGMLSVLRPQMITPAPNISLPPGKLKEVACKPLEATGQKMGHAVGFFEQGILIGLGVTTLVVLPFATWLAWSMSKRVLSYWR